MSKVERLLRSILGETDTNEDNCVVKVHDMARKQRMFDFGHMACLEVR